MSADEENAGNEVKLKLKDCILDERCKITNAANREDKRDTESGEGIDERFALTEEFRTEMETSDRLQFNEDDAELLKHEDESESKIPNETFREPNPPELMDIDDAASRTAKSKKSSERGVVYLSSIPTAMDLQQIRLALGALGPLGRVYLQQDHDPRKRRAKRNYYVEGWVEYKRKADAKRAARILNCSVVGGKKRHPWYADTWNMKYLSRFKWHNLVDRLAYERAVEEQKMRLEVGNARKEAHHFRDLADKAQADKRVLAKGKDVNRREWQFYQKQTEDEIKTVIQKKASKTATTPTTMGEDETVESAEKKKGGHKRKRKGGNEKNSATEVKAKKRQLIKAIFQGGDDDN